MIFIILLAVLCSLIYVHFEKTYNYWNKRGVKNVKPKTYAGSLSQNVLLRKSVPIILQEQYERFKDDRYFGMYQITLPTFVVKDLDLIKAITVKDFDKFVDHVNHANEDLDPLWSKNLLALMGDRWRDVRTTLSPAFTGSKMRLMFNLVNDESLQFVQYFLDQNQEIVSGEMKNIFSRISNDVLASCAFGIKVDSLKDPQNDFIVNGRKAFDFSGFSQLIFFLFSATPRLLKFFGIKLFADKTSAFLRNIIVETIQVREKEGIVRPDMIHLMLQARKGTLSLEDEKNYIDSPTTVLGVEDYHKGKTKKQVQLSDEDIVAQAMIFHFGGFDTTSSLLACMAYELAINTEIQDRLRAEVFDTLEMCNGRITYDHLMKMKYMDMVVSESLRLWPPLILSDRLCSGKYVIPAKRPMECDVTLERGDVIWIPIFAMHRDPEYFPEPTKFDPERFNDENKVKIPAFAYSPFSLGPRNCIASRFALMTIKCVMFQLLRKFDIVPVEKTRIPFVLSKKHVNIMCEGGLYLGFKRRAPENIR